MTDCRKQCVWRGRTRQSFRTEQDGEKRRGKMKREVCWMSTIFTIVLLGSAGVAQAQETQSQEIQIQETQEGPPGPMVTGGAMAGEAGTVTIQAGPAGEGQVMVQAGSVGEGGAFFENHIELLGFGGGVHGGKVVKGAPFSAVAVSESTQTLADGNHITRKTQTNLYRDSVGRFRKEVSLPAIGPLAASGKPHSLSKSAIRSQEPRMCSNQTKRWRGKCPARLAWVIAGNACWKDRAAEDPATSSIGLSKSLKKPPKPRPNHSAYRPSAELTRKERGPRERSQ